MNVASLARDTYDRDVGVRAVFRDLASVAGEEGEGEGLGGGVVARVVARVTKVIGYLEQSEAESR